VSQRSFLQMLTREEVYSAEAPTLWDIDFRTAVSQAELEDRERPGAYHRIAFDRADNAGTVDVARRVRRCSPVASRSSRTRTTSATSRCSDRSWSRRSSASRCRSSPTNWPTGKRHRYRDDLHVRRYDRRGVVARIEPPDRALIGRDGRFLAADFADESLPVRDAELAQEFYDRDVLGKTVNQARATIVDALRSTGALIGEVREITHPVKFYEKGERPLEIVTSRQWSCARFERRDELLARGEELHWHPTTCVTATARGSKDSTSTGTSRDKRFFGVPFPRGTPWTTTARSTSTT